MITINNKTFKYTFDYNLLKNSPKILFENCTFSNIVIENCNFTEICVFKDCLFENALFLDCNIFSAFYYCTIKNSIFSYSNFKWELCRTTMNNILFTHCSFKTSAISSKFTNIYQQKSVFNLDFLKNTLNCSFFEHKNILKIDTCFCDKNNNSFANTDFIKNNIEDNKIYKILKINDKLTKIITVIENKQHYTHDEFKKCLKIIMNRIQQNKFVIHKSGKEIKNIIRTQELLENIIK